MGDCPAGTSDGLTYITEPGQPTVLVPCKACGGTGQVNRGVGEWNGHAWVGGGLHACDGCHGAGVHRL